MAVKYSTFSEFLEIYYSSWNYPAGFLKTFSKMIHMADYLQDVNVDAYKITKTVEKYRKLYGFKL